MSIKSAIRIIGIALVPLVSLFINLPIIDNDLDLVSEKPLGSDAAVSMLVLSTLLFLANTPFTVKLRDIVAVSCLVLWGTGVSSEYNSTATALEVVLFTLLRTQGSYKTRKGVWSLLAISGVCWINSSLFNFGFAFFAWFVQFLDQVHDSYGSRTVQVCALLVSFLLLAIHQYMILLPIASLGISFYVFQNEKVCIPERITAALLSTVASVFIHPLLGVLAVILYFGSVLLDLKTHFENGGVEDFIGVVLLREIVMPSPGLSRLGPITNMTGLLACIVLGIMMKQCAKRLAQNLLENDCTDVVLTYLIFGIFKKCMVVTLGLWLTIMIGMTMLILYIFMLLFLKSNEESPPSVKSQLFVGVVWLTFAIALNHLLPHRPQYWYDLTSEQQHGLCSKRILLGEGQWSNVEYSSRLALGNIHAYSAGESATCRTFYPDITDVWKQKKILVMGDSIGRYTYYGLIHKLKTEQYGFSGAAIHHDLHATTNLNFHWSPFVGKALDAVATASSVDLLVVSVGLWDKRWHSKAVQEYGTTIRKFLGAMNAAKKRPAIAWVEMTSTMDQNLPPNQRVNWAKSGAQVWRDQVRNATSVYKGRISIIPTKNITFGRPSHDGIHYDMHAYKVIAEAILRSFHWL